MCARVRAGWWAGGREREGGGGTDGAVHRIIP